MLRQARGRRTATLQQATAALVMSIILVGACDGIEPAAETARPPTTALPTTSAVRTATTTPPPIPRGGEIVVAGDQEPPTLNPLVPGGDNDIVFALAQAYIPGAYDVNPDLELVPDLVTELPTPENGGVIIEPDGTMAVTWEIRQEAVWADGVPISGDDFAYTLALPAVPRANGPDVTLPEIAAVATSAKSITIHFTEPTIDYEWLFRWVVPRHAVAESDFERDWNTAMWPSGGPFAVDEWIPGESLRLVRNEHYWNTDATSGERLPYLDSVVYRFIPSDTRLLDAISSGDIALAFPPSPTAAELDRATGTGAQLDMTPGTIEEALLFSFGDDNPTGSTLNRSLDYRRAVASALDRKILAAAWLGIEGMASTDSLLAGDVGPWAAYPYDPAAAANLLAAACPSAGRDCATHPPPVRLRVTGNGTDRVAVAATAATMLRATGFAADVDVFTVIDVDPYSSPWDLTIVGRQVTAGHDRLLESFWPFDPDSSFQPMYEYRWASADGGPEAARFLGLLDEMRRSFDPAALDRLASAAEQILADEMVAIPLFRRPTISVLRTDRLAGFVPHPSRADVLWSIEQWYVPSAATSDG